MKRKKKYPSILSNLYPSNNITLKQEEIRNSTTYITIEHKKKQKLLIKNPRITAGQIKSIETYSKILNSLIKYCNLSTSEYDYIKSLESPSLW